MPSNQPNNQLISELTCKHCKHIASQYDGILI